MFVVNVVIVVNEKMKLLKGENGTILRRKQSEGESSSSGTSKFVLVNNFTLS